jgi:hypothetical protein
MVAAALVAALACPGQPAVLVHREPGIVRTTAVACDGDRRVVVRRARLLRPASSRPTGRRIATVSGAGRRVAWGELRHARGFVSAFVGITRIGRARPLRVRRASVPRERAPYLEVLLARRGALAWQVGHRLWRAYPQRRAWLLDEQSWGSLTIEDGRTLRWTTRGGELRYEELALWPEGACPARRRFRVVAENDQVVVTAAEYGPFAGDRIRVFRACLRENPNDEVISQVRIPHGSGPGLELLAIRGEWVMLLRRVGSFHGCWFSLEVHHATLGSGRDAPWLDCGREPGPGTPLVVTEFGAAAWIVEEQHRSVLLTGVGDGVIELDVAAPGGITGLVADERAVHWLHEGEPRSAALHLTPMPLAFGTSATKRGFHER